MSDTIIVAVLALVGSLAGTYFSNKKTTALIEHRLKCLEEKQDKHNSVVERVFELEKHEAVIYEEIKVVNHRINDLENFHK